MLFVLVFDICMIFVLVFDICMIFVLVFDICMIFVWPVLWLQLAPQPLIIGHWTNSWLAISCQISADCPSSSFFPDHNPISNHQPTPSSTLLFGHFWSPVPYNLISDRHYSVILSASLKSVHSFQWVPCGCDDWGVVWLLRLWTGFSELSKYSLTL